jgi:hypothetical protein
LCDLGAVRYGTPEASDANALPRPSVVDAPVPNTCIAETRQSCNAPGQRSIRIKRRLAGSNISIMDGDITGA